MKKTFLYLRTDIGTRDVTSGGSVTHTFGVINGLIAGGHTIHCASSAMHTLLERKQAFSFKALKVPRLLKLCGHKLTCLVSNILFLTSTLLFLRSKNIHYIYQRYSMLNVVGIMLARIKRVPLILEFNGSEAWVDVHWSPQKKLRVNRLVALCEQWNVQRADYIVVVSQVLKDMLVAQGVHAKKILVNPNGVDVEQFNPARYHDARMVIRNAYGINDRYVFGFIGSFSYWHGVEIISQMIPFMKALQPRAHFLLIGSGPLLESIKATIQKAQCEDMVTFVGNVVYSKAPEYLSACDAYLCPSQPNADGTPFFGSPTKLFEYMSMAKPIIASDVDQLRDIINERFGYCVAPDDVQGFVRAACMLIQHDISEQKQMGDYARASAIKQFSWKTHVDRIRHFIS